MPEYAPCAGHKRSGDPCTLSARPPSAYCWAHDPQNAEARSRHASKAASSKRQDNELAQIKSRIREVAEGVLSGSIETGRCSVAFQGFGVLVRYIEQERKQRETEELAARVEQLEETIEAQRQEQGGGWYYGS
jgi:hypothetical protein